MRRILTGLAAVAGLWTGAAAADERGYGIPNGHLPPPGECRVWFDDRPPGQQPPPTSCRQAERNAYRYGGRVVYGGDRGYDDRGRGYDDHGYDDHDDDRRRGERMLVCVDRDDDGYCERRYWAYH